MQRAAVALGWVSAAVAAVAFFLPWATVDVRDVGGWAGRVTLEVQGFPQRISGAQIPGLMRREETRAAVALAELFTGTLQHAALKSYAVFLLPGVAFICSAVLTCWGTRPAVAGAVSLLCAAIAAAGFWNALRLNAAQSVIAVSIGRGVWLSLWAYVGLAVSAGLVSIIRRVRA